MDIFFTFGFPFGEWEVLWMWSGMQWVFDFSILKMHEFRCFVPVKFGEYAICLCSDKNLVAADSSQVLDNSF